MAPGGVSVQVPPDFGEDFIFAHGLDSPEGVVAIKDVPKRCAP